MRSHSSCLFHTGQSLLVDFDLCAFTRLVFFTLASRCWWTLACAFPLVLSFLTLVNRCWWTLACALPTVLSFLTLVRRCSRTLTCALPLVFSFLTLVAPFCGAFPYRRRRHGARARAPWRRRYGKSLTPTLTLTLTPTCCRLYNPILPVKRCNPNLLSVV